MPDRPDSAEVARANLQELVERWRAGLGALEQEAGDSASLAEAERALADATSTDAYDDLERMLMGVVRRADRAAGAVDGFASRVRRLRADWVAERRHAPAELGTLVQDLSAALAEDEVGGARRWFGELFDALDAGRWDVVDVLLGDDLAWPERVSGARAVGDSIRVWTGGDHEAARATMDALGSDAVDGLEGVLTDELRSRAHRLSAWISLRRLGEAERALESLDEAVETYKRSGRMHAEKAAYFLFMGDLDRGAAEAHRANELAADDPAGYLQLGVWAELSGDYSGADDLYAIGLGLMPMYEVARLHARTSLLDPTGRLLVAAAQRLVDLGRPERALAPAEHALKVEVRGTQAHPEADAHRARSVALQAVGRQPEAAASAMEAGRLYVWNGDAESSLEQLERAIALDDSLEEAGWLLADALLSTSLPLGETLPAHGSVSSARDQWERWRRKVGPPRGGTSWAYLTRAIVEDLITQRPGTDRRAGVWGALAYVERALVHDDVDAQRWGYAAQYLRYAGFEQLAYEAVTRGYERFAGDRQVLAERLPLLANRGDLDAAEDAADQLVRMYGPDPWVWAVRAWLAMHRGQFKQAVELLELPIAEGNDPAWYYEMRALCRLAEADLESARRDYGALRDNAPPIDGTTKCRLATAGLVLGDRQGAEAWLHEAEDDPTRRETDFLRASALAAFAAGDPARGGDILEEAIGAATSVVEVDDLAWQVKLQLRVIGDGEHMALGDGLNRLEGAAKTRSEWLAAHGGSADSELEEALEEYDGGGEGADLELAEVALIAVSCRRHAHADRLDEAIAGYERLRDSRFEPEATAALIRVVRDAGARAAEDGDVEAVRNRCRRLAELGATTPVHAALFVADALRAAGQLEEARDHVAAHADGAADESERMAIQRRLGALSVELGDLAGAARDFGAALSSAESLGDDAARGQIQIRLALVARLADDAAAADGHLQAALETWREAAFDPAGALLEEVLALRERARGEGHWTRVASDALDWIEATLLERRAATREPQPA